MENWYHNQSVVVTGGAGFIGASLVRELLACGARVTVLVRPGGKTWRLAAVRDRIAIIEVELANQEQLTSILRSTAPIVLFNLASLVKTAQALSELDVLILHNFSIARAVAQAAVDADVTRMVHVGSIEEYGLGEVPFVETAREQPISPYSLSKVMVTHMLALFHHLTALKTCVIRPSATYGPMQGWGMLTPNFIRACMEGRDFSMNLGEQVRDLLYVEDTVQGLLAAGATPEAYGEIINLGSGNRYRVKDIVLLINQLMGNPITVQFGAYPYRPLDTMRFYSDAHKAHQLLGWHARIPLVTGMERTVAWYRDHGEMV